MVLNLFNFEIVEVKVENRWFLVSLSPLSSGCKLLFVKVGLGRKAQYFNPQTPFSFTEFLSDQFLECRFGGIVP